MTLRSKPAETVKQLLLADPSAAFVHSLERDHAGSAEIIGCHNFHDARTHLLDATPDVLVTNLRLFDYNGLHLILLVKAASRQTICIVHTDRPDLLLIREAQASGAFFERTDRLSRALEGYLTTALPERDRRDPEQSDRRATFRGGRRAADQAVLAR